MEINVEEVIINTETIQLDQFLKWANIVGSGGEAKFIIKESFVKVNNIIENRRSRKLEVGDIVQVNDLAFKIV